jgi:hypothetical protein
MVEEGGIVYPARKLIDHQIGLDFLGGKNVRPFYQILYPVAIILGRRELVLNFTTIST